MKIRIATIVTLFVATLCKAQALDSSIENIFSTKCASCHIYLPNQPIDFTNKKSILYNRKLIAHVVASGFMPMWKADPDFRHFDNQSILSPDQVTQILNWCKSNNTIKDLKIPRTRFFPKADLKIKSEIIKVPNSLSDIYATIKIPFTFNQEYVIKGFEFLPNLAKNIHHVSIFLVKESEGTDITKGLSTYFYSGNEYQEKDFNLYYKMNLVSDNRKTDFWNNLIYKTHWQYGASSYTLPEGAGFILPKRGAIVLDNIHYKGTGSELSDQYTFNFLKSDSKNIRQIISTSLGNGQVSTIYPPLIIQPGKIQTHYSEVTLPGDMALMEVTPHMHYLGNEFISWAISPAGDSIPIIKIKKWDADWQETYRFNPLLKLTKGTKIIIKGIFDNTINNPKNPNNPPKLVQQSMNKHDEMLEMLITFLIYQKGDEQKIVNYRNF